MISDYKLDTNKVYICDFKDDQYPQWHHPYLKDLFAGTPAEVAPRVEEFKKFIAMENGGGENAHPMRVVKLGNAIYAWSEEVKKFSIKRQAQLRKNNGGDATLVNHPAANEFLKQLKDLGFKRIGKKNLRYGATGVEYTLRKIYGPVEHFPQYTWCADLIKDVGTDRDGDELTTCHLYIKILNTADKKIAANTSNIYYLYFGPYFRYSTLSPAVEDLIDVFCNENNLYSREVRDDVDRAASDFMRSNNLKYKDEKVFSADMCNNWYLGDRLLDIFDQIVSDLTPAQIEEKITNAIDAGNRLTNDPAEITQHNEAVGNRVVSFVRDYLSNLDPHSFSESLDKNRTVDELLSELED